MGNTHIHTKTIFEDRLTSYCMQNLHCQNTDERLFMLS